MKSLWHWGIRQDLYPCWSSLYNLPCMYSESWFILLMGCINPLHKSLPENVYQHHNPHISELLRNQFVSTEYCPIKISMKKNWEILRPEIGQKAIGVKTLVVKLIFAEGKFEIKPLMDCKMFLLLLQMSHSAIYKSFHSSHDPCSRWWECLYRRRYYSMFVLCLTSKLYLIIFHIDSPQTMVVMWY